MRPDQNPACFLARFTDTPCDGQLVRCHLIPRQQLRRVWQEAEARNRRGLTVEQVAGLPVLPWTLDELVRDRRSWVLGCGGVIGNGGHHGELDFSRKLRIPRDAIPTWTEELALELGLTWWLDREYGERASA